MRGTCRGDPEFTAAPRAPACLTIAKAGRPHPGTLAPPRHRSRTAMKLVPEVTALVAEKKAWRHHLHAHPESAFEQPATSAFVADKLRPFGLDLHPALAK